MPLRDVMRWNSNRTRKRIQTGWLHQKQNPLSLYTPCHCSCFQHDFSCDCFSLWLAKLL